MYLSDGLGLLAPINIMEKAFLLPKESPFDIQTSLYVGLLTGLVLRRTWQIRFSDGSLFNSAN